VLFWIIVFIINAGPHWEVYVSNKELIETVGLLTLLQLIVAWISARLLVPLFLESGKIWQFCFWVFLTIVIAAYVQITVRYFYLEPSYPIRYQGFLSRYGEMSFVERVDPRWTMRYIIFSKLPQLIFPAMVILAYSFYQKQQSLLLLREQKRSAELDALKNQLNPHFSALTLPLIIKYLYRKR